MNLTELKIKKKKTTCGASQTEKIELLKEGGNSSQLCQQQQQLNFLIKN